MKWYAIGKTLTPLDRAPESGAAVVLLNSDELAHETALPGLEAVLHHTPSARDAHVCKAEVRSNCLSGTLALPRGRRDGTRLCCGYLVTKDRVVLVDDGEMAEPYLKRIVKEKRLTENSVGRFLYDFFELLIARDLHRLEEIEDRATALEDRVLSGELEEFSTPMSELRKETMAWYRYYSQLDDVACELRENENGYFSDEECRLFRLFEERVIRLRYFRDHHGLLNVPRHKRILVKWAVISRPGTAHIGIASVCHVDMHAEVAVEDIVVYCTGSVQQRLERLTGHMFAARNREKVQQRAWYIRRLRKRGNARSVGARARRVVDKKRDIGKLVINGHIVFSDKALLAEHKAVIRVDDEHGVLPEVILVE